MARTGSPGRAAGAAARAAHRAERIAAIDAELGTLAAVAAQRANRRGELDATSARIDGHVRAAPVTRDLFASRSRAADAAQRAEASALIAAREAERARSFRAEWAAQLSAHE